MSGSRGGWVTDGLILAAWLASMAGAAFYERGAFGWMPGLPPLTAAPANVQEQWFGVYYQGEKIGFTHLRLAPDEQDGFPGVSLIDDGRLRLTLLGSAQQIRIQASSFIDAQWRLRRLSAKLEADAYRLEITGERQGDQLLLTVSTPASTRRQRLYDPSGRIWISGLSSWAAFHRLAVGQRGQLWLINPLALKPEPATFHVLKRETLDGQEAVVIETAYQGLTAMTWLGPAGQVLKETSPMGWLMVQEPMERAMASTGATVDLLSTTAVPVDRPLAHPERLARLTLAVDGVGPDAFQIDRRPWQAVEPASASAASPPPSPSCVVRLQRPALDGPLSPSTPTPAHAAPSAFIQSDDEEIRRQARAIVGGTSDRWQQVLALHRWVYETLAKRLTIGLPSAKDVLASKSGDCHEHTVLFTGLARSLGIPTRMVAGLVYYQARFYYHAWPEVWLSADAAGRSSEGRWISVDPTTGQALADATHIGLVEAEDERLISLGQFVGRIRLKVLQSLVDSP